MNTPFIKIEDAVKIFTLHGLAFRRKSFFAIDHVSMEIKQGQTIGLVGESGSGKSTLGRCILSLLRLDGGKIIFRGLKIHNMKAREFRPLRRELQMVFQSPKTSFNPSMTIGQSIINAMCLRTDLSKKAKLEYLIELLNQVQLSPLFAGKFPWEVSGGELQRAGLARALAVQPKFIFLDEPTSALDISIRGQIVNLLLDIQERNKLTYIFVSHDLQLIRYVADYIYVMYMGQIMESGKREELFSYPLHPYTRALLRATLLGREERRQARLQSLKGEVIAYDWSGKGCKLAPRCAEATPKCFEETQFLHTINGRQVRCWRV